MKSSRTIRSLPLIFLGILAAITGLRAADLVVPETVMFERDIEFANPDNQHLQVNLAMPKGGDALRPAVVCIHGGGFRVFRVRHVVRDGEAPRALVQVEPSELPRVASIRDEIERGIREAGYAAVEIDPLGYRGPSL